MAFVVIVNCKYKLYSNGNFGCLFKGGLSTNPGLNLSRPDRVCGIYDTGLSHNHKKIGIFVFNLGLLS